MKKLTLLIICIATLGLASCKKDTIVQENSANNLTIIKYIEPNQWQLSNNGLTYTAILNDSRIDSRTFEDDGILVYVSRGDNNGYEQIPFVYDVQSFSYQVYQGSVAIDIQSADGPNRAPVRPTTRTRVKIVLIESFQ